MASKRREPAVKADEQAPKLEGKPSMLVMPVVKVVDISTGDTESIWVWELED